MNDIDARMALMERHAQRVGESDADYLARLDVFAAWAISGKQPEVVTVTRSSHLRLSCVQLAQQRASLGVWMHLWHRQTPDYGDDMSRVMDGEATCEVKVFGGNVIMQVRFTDIRRGRVAQTLAPSDARYLAIQLCDAADKAEGIGGTR